MRIVAGRHKGHALATPRSQTIRPTSDRLREAVFNILIHTYDALPAGARVLDLFAGTGALGLEALSRGAQFAVFVDDGVEARGLIRCNVEAMQLTGATKIFKRDATQLGDIGTLEPFDLVLCDPPYGRGLAEKALHAARSGGWFRPQALILVEESASAVFLQPEGYEQLDRRVYGDTQVLFLRFIA